MARDRAPPATRRIDWHGLRAEFISSDCTLTSLANKVDADLREFKRRASREGWPRLRDEWRRAAAAHLAGERIVAQVTTAAELDRRAHETALASMEDAQRRAEAGARDGSDLRANVAALRDAWQLARLAIGLPAEPTTGTNGKPEVISRVRDEHGNVYDLALDGSEPEPVDGGPVGLPADANAGEVPSGA